MSFKYPLDATRALAQRVDQVPAGASYRRWVLRDDNERHYHAVVRVSESPVYVELLIANIDKAVDINRRWPD